MNFESPLWRRCYLHLRWYFSLGTLRKQPTKHRWRPCVDLKRADHDTATVATSSSSRWICPFVSYVSLKCFSFQSVNPLNLKVLVQKCAHILMSQLDICRITLATTQATNMPRICPFLMWVRKQFFFAVKERNVKYQLNAFLLHEHDQTSRPRI